MLRAVLLDFDGTLVDTLNLHVETLLKTLERFGIVAKKEDVEDKIGMSFKDIIEKISINYPKLKEIDINEIKKIKRKLFLENIDKIKLHKGAKELLDFLKRKNIKVALTTSSNKDFVNIILDKFNINKYFDVVITADDVTKAKPEPEIFLKAIDYLNVKPYDALVIDDSIYGIIAAKRAGIPVFAVLTGVNKRKDLQKLNPNGIFKDLYEVYLYLQAKLV